MQTETKPLVHEVIRINTDNHVMLLGFILERIGDMHLVYAQNRIFAARLHDADGSGLIYTTSDEKLISDYCIIPEIDEMIFKKD